MSKYRKIVNKYLQGFQNGDREQLGKVFDLTANHLCAVAYKYLINKSYCDDVVSDAFCKVLQYISSFNAEQDGYNWLCKIVEKTAYSYNEKEKEKQENSLTIDAIENLGNEDGHKEIKLDLLIAMDKLTVQNRNMVYDYYYRDLTYSEIADKYHIAKSAVHKRIKNSFKKMKNMLQEGEQID